MARYVKPKQDSGPTRFLYVSGIGHSLKSDPIAIAMVFSKFGSLSLEEGNVGPEPSGCGVEFVENKRFCFVIFEDVESAAAAQKALNHVEIAELGGIKVLIRFAQEATPVQGVKMPDCTSSTADIRVPGLQLIKDFITIEEEQQLLEGLCGTNANWEQTLNRRVQVGSLVRSFYQLLIYHGTRYVQHFGFKFNYRTLLLDYASKTEEIPSSFDGMIEKLVTIYNHVHSGSELESSEVNNGNAGRCGSSSSSSRSKHAMLQKQQINQLTLNEYQPGQGIASHIGLVASHNFLSSCNRNVCYDRYRDVLRGRYIHCFIRFRSHNDVPE
jgi:RNA recognition motif-containing protein